MHVEEGKAPFYLSICHLSSPVLITVGTLVVPPMYVLCMSCEGEQRNPLWFPYPLSSCGSLSPLMEKETRDSSRPRPEEPTEKEARRVRPRVWKGQAQFLSTDEEQLIPPCYRFPSSFLRFPSPFCLQTSWCSWMRKENKEHGVAPLYPCEFLPEKRTVPTS